LGKKRPLNTAKRPKGEKLRKRQTNNRLRMSLRQNGKKKPEIDERFSAAVIQGVETGRKKGFGTKEKCG